jgi:hypothetical protein
MEGQNAGQIRVQTVKKIVTHLLGFLREQIIHYKINKQMTNESSHFNRTSTQVKSDRKNLNMNHRRYYTGKGPASAKRSGESHHQRINRSGPFSGH